MDRAPALVPVFKSENRYSNIHYELPNQVSINQANPI